MKQQRFADEYIISGNIYNSLIKAGYSENYAKADGCKILENPSVKNYIDEKLKELSDKKVANQQEVLEYLTSVMRGESNSEVVVIEGQGEGISRAKPMQKAPDERERLKAAELLGKRMGLFKEKVELSTEEPSKKLSDILDQLGGEGLEE
nr:MAG TPA: Terminase small subunit [Caudoviricetes sp.]